MQIETLFISKVIVDLDYDTPRGEWIGVYLF